MGWTTIKMIYLRSKNPTPSIVDCICAAKKPNIQEIKRRTV